MRIKSIVIFSILITSGFLGILTKIAPSIDDLWAENPYWNGLANVQSTIKPIRIDDLTKVGLEVQIVSNSTLLLLGPSKHFDDVDIEIINGYLSNGGRVILADDFGTGNELLEGLDIPVRFTGMLMEDTLYYETKPEMPRIINFTIQNEGVNELVMNYPTTLETGEGLRIFASSTTTSLVSTDEGDNSYSLKAYPVIGLVEKGEGDLVLISDPSLFINSMLGKADNSRLLTSFLKGTVVLDESHSIPTLLTRMKIIIADTYLALGNPFYRYGLVMALVLLIVRTNFDKPEYIEKRDIVEEVLRKHPEWSRNELETLQRMRAEALEKR